MNKKIATVEPLQNFKLKIYFSDNTNICCSVEDIILNEKPFKFLKDERRFKRVFHDDYQVIWFTPIEYDGSITVEIDIDDLFERLVPYDGEKNLIGYKVYSM